MRKAWGKAIVRLAERDDRIMVLTGDVVQEMDEFCTRWPGRFTNLGITEQSIIGVAAGLAINGLRPVVYSLTPFVLERPFEQVKIDIDEQNVPVILVGFSDYPTHGPTHRALDVEGLARLFKNVNCFFPQSAMQAEKALLDAYLMGGPAFISLKKDGLPSFRGRKGCGQEDCTDYRGGQGIGAGHGQGICLCRWPRPGRPCQEMDNRIKEDPSGRGSPC